MAEIERKGISVIGIEMVMMLITKMMVTMLMMVLITKAVVMIVLTPRTRPTFCLPSLPLARSSPT